MPFQLTGSPRTASKQLIGELERRGVMSQPTVSHADACQALHESLAAMALEPDLAAELLRQFVNRLMIK